MGMRAQAIRIHQMILRLSRLNRADSAYTYTALFPRLHRQDSHRVWRLCVDAGDIISTPSGAQILLSEVVNVGSNIEK